LSVYASPRAYDASEAAQQSGFASQSFIPSGLISPAGEPVDPPEPHALVAGHVREAEERRNSVTGNPFSWALVETIGGTFDAVIDPELVATPLQPGNVVTGWFWLSGRLMLDEKPKPGWRQRLIGR